MSEVNDTSGVAVGVAEDLRESAKYFDDEMSDVLRAAADAYEQNETLRAEVERNGRAALELIEHERRLHRAEVERLRAKVTELSDEAYGYAEQIERERDARREAVEALLQYVSHGRDDAMCERDKHSEYPCTCGLEDLVARVKSANGGVEGGE